MNIAEIVIGTPVIFWKVVRKDGSKAEPFKTEITSKPWCFSRQTKNASYCCCVKDVPRSVNIRNLEKIEHSIIATHFDI